MSDSEKAAVLCMDRYPTRGLHAPDRETENTGIKPIGVLRGHTGIKEQSANIMNLIGKLPPLGK